MQRRNDVHARMQLFCFPYAGGGASVFRTWQAELGRAIQVVPVQLPGRETRIREPLVRSVPALAETLTADIAPLIDRPFALFGYSFGSLLAFETARLLRKRGLAPDHLLVAALSAPQHPRSARRIHDLPTAEFAEEIRQLKGTPDSVLKHPELLELVLPKIQADFCAYETYTYRPEPPLACGISAMGGASDGSLSQAGLRAWSQHTTGEFSVQMFPGDHFFIHSACGILTWAILKDLLTRLRQAS
jgi:medium-chain acyl-[acyl-carrier-protein] hydrolase